MKRGKVAAASAAIAVCVAVTIEAARIMVSRERYSRARAEIFELRQELSQYREANGFYPTSGDGLGVLPAYSVAGDVDPGMVRGPHLQPSPDPWGRPYHYESDGNEYLLESLGPDGAGNEPTLTARSPN
jgi:hypothetical protein